MNKKEPQGMIELHLGGCKQNNQTLEVPNELYTEWKDWASNRFNNGCPLREEKSFSQRAFSIYTDIRKLQDKAKTSYTLSTRRLRFMSQTAQCLRHISHEPGVHSAQWEQWRMRQGNARIIVIHSFVFGLSIFLSLIVKSNGWNV